MKFSPALGWFAAALMLCSLPACQKKAENNTPEPKPPTAQPPAPKRIVSAEPNSSDAIGKHLDSGGGLYFYLSTESFMKAASERLTDVVATLMEAGKMTPEQKAQAQAAWQSLSHLTGNSGIKDITGFGVSSIALEPGYYQTKSMLHHYPGKGTGWLWNMSGSTPNALDFVAYLPATTAIASSANLKLQPLWKALQEEAATNANLRQGLDLLATQLKQSAGLDLAPLIASLGPNYSLVITLDESRMTNIPGGPNGNLSIPEPAIALFVQVQDDVLINRIDQQLSMLPMVTQSTEGDLKVRTLSMPLPFSFVRPMIASKKGLLIVSSNDQLVREMLDVKAGKKPGLTANPQFKKLMTGLPTSGCSFGYVAPSFQKAINGIQMASMQQSQNASDPAFQKMMKYVQQASQQGAAAKVVEETPEGWLATSHGGTGPAQIVAIGAVAPAALLAGIAVPSFLRARERTQATMAKQDLRMIDAAIDQWAIEHNKKPGDQATTDDLKPYLKMGTPLYNRLATSPGATAFPLVDGMQKLVIPPVGGKIAIPREIVFKFRNTCTPDFWTPYQAN